MPTLWCAPRYMRHVGTPDLWRLRKFIAIAREKTDLLANEPERELVRCGILRCGQWGLDMRDSLPSVPEFRENLVVNLRGMVEAGREYAKAARRADRLAPTEHPRRTVIITGRAQDLPFNQRLADYGAPKLILTSPPYPGVYVNYHRWKLRGRLETPFPYWIVKQLDGQGLSYYTMGARTQKGHLTKYFGELKSAFTAIAAVCDKDTVVMQVVGFSDPESQLPEYLDTMNAAGLREVTYGKCATDDDGRLWRDVPGRRWWTHTNGKATAKEVVLFHRVRARTLS